MTTTGISESFHSLLSSGKSAHNSLVDVLMKTDAIVINQTQKSLKRAAKWEEDQKSLGMCTIRGLSGASVSRLLSSKGFELFSDAADPSSMASFVQINPVDIHAANSFCVHEILTGGRVHIVSDRPFDSPSSGSVNYRRMHTIETSLGQNVDLGVSICAGCCNEANPTDSEVYGFDLPRKFELLYPGKYHLLRVVAALGIG
jgi:hypothetical protein